MTAPVGILAVTVNPASFRAFLAATKQFSPALATATRRRLRDAASIAVADVQGTVRQPPPGAGGFDVGVRAGIAGGIKVSILTGAKTAGVRIVATGSGLDAKHAAMLKAYNKPSFRHPVRGGATWVSESGRPFFGQVITKHRADAQAAVVQAINDAIVASGFAVHQ